MEKITFAIVGAGWRAGFYMQIAKLLPDKFSVAGVVECNPKQRSLFAQKWNCSVFTDMDKMFSAVDPLFVVTLVSPESNSSIVKELVKRDKAVLSETPPAEDLEQMIDLYRFVTKKRGKVQVAEQYFLQPHHAARLSAIQRGLIGNPSQAQISVAHGYHGISLIRRALGISYETATIFSRQHTSPIVEGPGRTGPPEREKIKDSVQHFSWLDFGDRLGLMDFTGEQYFSWIRNNRILVRGECGEIVNNTISYLRDYRTPIHLNMLRHEVGLEGNLEGNYLKGIQVGTEMFYTNPLAPAPLSDDEIAVGTCLLNMAEYVKTCKNSYSLAQACQDHYLNLMCANALRSGKIIETKAQIWSE